MTAARGSVPVVRLWGRRLRSRAGSLAALTLAVAALVGLVCGLLAGSVLAGQDSIRAALPDEQTPAGWLQIQTRPADDRRAQSEAAEAVIAAAVGDTVTVTPLTLGEPGSDLERVAWRLTPAAGLTTQSVQQLADGLHRLPDRFRSSPAAQGGSIATGSLATSAENIADAARATAAILPVPVALLAALGWFAALQLARLLGMSRSAETRLLQARGLSPRRSAVLAGLDAVSATVGGVAVGTVGAAVVLGAIWGRAGIAALVGTWPVVLITGVALVATITAGQLSAAGQRRSAATGRLARAASPALAVLLLAVAVVLVWQAATTPGTAWDTWAVTVTMLAPPVAVGALAVAALVVFGPVAALAARGAAGARGLAAVYPARQVARRVPAYAVGVVLVVITMAGAVLAGAYGATWTAATEQSQRLTAGAPLRAELDPVTPAALQQASTVGSAIPAYTTAVVAGDVGAALVAVPADRLPQVLVELPELAATLTADLAHDPLWAVLPDEATGVRLTGTVTGPAEAAAAATARAWVMDAAGTPASILLALTVDDRAFTATGDLPEGEGPWTLTATEVARGNAYPWDRLIFTDLRLVAVEGEAETELGLNAVPTASVHPPAAGAGGVRSALVWSAAGVQPSRVPAVVTSAFANRLGVADGDELDLRVDGSGRTVAATVVDVLPALPGIGSGPGVFVSLPGLVEASTPLGQADTAPSPPLAGEVWAAGDRVALAAALDVPVAVPGSPAQAVARELAQLWRAAALGGAALTGVALVALLWSLTHRRGGEVLALRALGVAPQTQTRLRAVESGIVVLLSIVLGAVGGMGLAAVLIPPLAARTMIDRQVAPALAVDVGPIALTVAVLVVACAIAAVGVSAIVRAQGASTRVEGTAS
ncbi:FtsX-like permease family protein [Microbacterium sp. MC2]